MDAEEIGALLLRDDESDEDIVSDLQDEDMTDNEVDEVMISDHNSCSEQSNYSDSSDSDDEPLPPIQKRCRSEKQFMLGKDKTTKWLKNLPVNSYRERPANIVRFQQKDKPYAKGKVTPFACFNCFIDDYVIDIIVTSTNIFIQKARQNFLRDHDAQDTNKIEILGLFGLLFLAGVVKSSKVNIKDLWDRNGMGMERFYVTMSYNRFAFLLRCLRFDNIHNQEERRQLDKLAAIRDVFGKFVENCKKAYTPSEFLTIDEKFEVVRGRCAFRQCIPNKPTKYGIKIMAVVDATSFYTTNLEVYVGKQYDGPFQLSNNPYDLVIRMLSEYSGSGRNVTMDNWFTSVNLARTLLNEHKITLTGAIRKNQKEIPPQMLNIKNREVKSSCFGFQKGVTIVSYVPRKGKNVILLSTMHSDDKIDESADENKQPEIITLYNKTKGGVDTVHQMCDSYSVSRNSRRWPLTTFFAIMNIAGINAQIIFLNNTVVKMKRRHFLRSLAFELTDGLIKYRATLTTIPRDLKSAAMRIGNVFETPKVEVFGKKQGGRCYLCPRSKDRKTRFVCLKCKQLVCLEHSSNLCHDCCVEATEG